MTNFLRATISMTILLSAVAGVMALNAMFWAGIL